MLRVAVCWSGLIRGVPEAAKLNKQIFDNITKKTNGDITFDHYCHFWNSDNRYPYQFDKEFFDKHLNQLEGIYEEDPNDKFKIINTLHPKLISCSNVNSMSWVLEQHRFASHPLFNPLADVFEFIKGKTIDENTFPYNRPVLVNTANTVSIVDNLDLFEIWGWVHNQYCGLMNRQAQFYSFEKSVTLVKEYNENYDLILKMRYDISLIPNEINKIIAVIQKSFNEDSMLVNDFREHENVFPEILTLDSANKDGHRYGIEDFIFIGPIGYMYRLAENIFVNSSKYYCFNKDSDNIWSEHTLLNEILTKNIPCRSLSPENLTISSALFRYKEDITVFRECNYDYKKYGEKFKEHREVVNHLHVISSMNNRYLRILYRSIYKLPNLDFCNTCGDTYTEDYQCSCSSNLTK
jgi:hypothetical protein